MWIAGLPLDVPWWWTALALSLLALHTPMGSVRKESRS